MAIFSSLIWIAMDFPERLAKLRKEQSIKGQVFDLQSIKGQVFDLWQSISIKGQVFDLWQSRAYRA